MGSFTTTDSVTTPSQKVTTKQKKAKERMKETTYLYWIFKFFDACKNYIAGRIQ